MTADDRSWGAYLGRVLYGIGWALWRAVSSFLGGLALGLALAVVLGVVALVIFIFETVTS